MFDYNVVIIVAISGSVLAFMVWYMLRRTEEALENTKKSISVDAKEIVDLLHRIDLVEKQVNQLEREIDTLKLDIAMLREAVFGEEGLV